MPSDKFKVMRAVADTPKSIDYTALYIDLCSKYRNVFIVKIADTVYIYRAIGRSEYREIMEDRRFSDIQKEELICTQCLLYPDPDTYSWDDKNAGIPTELTVILTAWIDEKTFTTIIDRKCMT